MQQRPCALGNGFAQPTDSRHHSERGPRGPEYALMTRLAETLSNSKGSLEATGQITLPFNQALALSVDTLVEGIHFPAGSAPRDLGHKALAVNLSDLAAMGANPLWATLSLTLPEDDRPWFEAFTEGFLALARRFRVTLLAVEKTRGAMSITVETGGSVPQDHALRRDGAQPGELVFVTGSLGDAGAALQAMQGHLPLPGPAIEALVTHLNRPEPRVREGLVLREFASSAIDVSDGLAADLGHILERSGVGAELDVEKLPISPLVMGTIGRETAWRLALTSGDDYELCFTLPPDKRPSLERAWKRLDCPLTLVGRVVAQVGLTGRRADSSEFRIGRGYEHFT